MSSIRKSIVTKAIAKPPCRLLSTRELVIVYNLMKHTSKG